jgi:antitoxin (DNA-binding transcriptional repressor) of toxin-antitoxin stability system
MKKITLDQAQSNLPEIVRSLQPDDEVVITDNERIVARLVPAQEEPPQPRKFGSMRGTVLYLAPDFDAPLEDFREYME